MRKPKILNPFKARTAKQFRDAYQWNYREQIKRGIISLSFPHDFNVTISLQIPITYMLLEDYINPKKVKVKIIHP